MGRRATPPIAAFRGRQLRTASLAALLIVHRRPAAKTIADRRALCHERASPTTSSF